MFTSKIIATLEDKKLQALEQIPNDHLLSPYNVDPCTNVANTKNRIQNFAFS